MQTEASSVINIKGEYKFQRSKLQPVSVLSFCDYVTITLNNSHGKSIAFTNFILAMILHALKNIMMPSTIVTRKP